MKQNGNDTIRKVIEVSNSIDAGLSENDVSVAHRLTSQMHIKPVIVRFSRRVAKMKLLPNKKKLGSLSVLNDVKIYEDLTRPTMNFIKLMESATGLNLYGQATAQSLLSGNKIEILQNWTKT